MVAHCVADSAIVRGIESFTTAKTCRKMNIERQSRKYPFRNKYRYLNKYMKCRAKKHSEHYARKPHMREKKDNTDNDANVIKYRPSRKDKETP